MSEDYDEAIIIHRDFYGRVRLENAEWPKRTRISRRLIEDADPEIFSVDEGVVEIHLGDSHARYRVDSDDGPPYDVWRCSLIEEES